MLGLVFIFLSVSSAWMTILGAIALAIYTSSYALGLEVTPVNFIILSIMLMLVPAASYIAASLLDRFTFGKRAPGILKPLAVVFSLLFVFQSDVFAELLPALLSGLAQQSLAALLVPVKTAALAGAGVSVVYMLAILFFEVPATWLFGLSGLKGGSVFRSLRPVATVLLLTVSAHLALEFILYSLRI